MGNQSVFGEFAEQLEQKPEGFFETGLLWKGDCPHLPDNKAGSLACLEKPINRLERDPDLYMKYDQIIQDQKEKGIVEVVDQGPTDIVTSPSEDTERESKLIKEILRVAYPVKNELDEVLGRFEYWKAMRVTAWIVRFIRNSQAKKASRIKGPLSTPEIQEQITKWVKRVQSRAKSNDSFKEDEQKLNIQENDEGILECRGRIQGQCPIYLPSDTLFTEKLVMDSHISTGHGGVSLTMSSVRDRFWVPRLRKLVKKLRFKCAGCKRFHARAFNSPPPGILPKDRTGGSRPFGLIGVDYAGPIRYRCGKAREKHNLVHHGKENQISVGDVVLIKGEAKNRGGWAIGVVESLIKGKDNIVRAARLSSKKKIIERAVQMLYPLELACDEEHKKTEARVNYKENARLNAQAK